MIAAPRSQGTVRKSNRPFDGDSASKARRSASSDGSRNGFGSSRSGIGVVSAGGCAWSAPPGSGIVAVSCWASSRLRRSTMRETTWLTSSASLPWKWRKVRPVSRSCSMWKVMPACFRSCSSCRAYRPVTSCTLIGSPVRCRVLPSTLPVVLMRRNVSPVAYTPMPSRCSALSSPYLVTSMMTRVPCSLTRIMSSCAWSSAAMGFSRHPSWFVAFQLPPAHRFLRRTRCPSSRCCARHVPSERSEVGVVRAMSRRRARASEARLRVSCSSMASWASSPVASAP